MRILINGIMSDGSLASQELISRAGWVIKDTTIAIIDNGEIVPLKIGETELICNIGGITSTRRLIINKV